MFQTRVLGSMRNLPSPRHTHRIEDDSLHLHWTAGEKSRPAISLLELTPPGIALSVNPN